jgi:hypothetical protein
MAMEANSATWPARLAQEKQPQGGIKADDREYGVGKDIHNAILNAG